MATTIAHPESKAGGPRSPQLPPPPRGGDGGPGRNWGGYPGGLPVATYKLGMIFGLASISMLFMGLTSAYIVQQGLTGNQPITMPQLLLVNTVVLIASSVTLELGRRASSVFWLAGTFALGVLFVAGQITAWRQLAAEGIYLSSSPQSSFFFTLTGAHALHLAGGVLALAFVVFKAWRAQTPPARMARWTGVTAMYWHFMDGLWVYLMVLLFWGR